MSASEVGLAIRRADREALGLALQASRADTLATFALFEAAGGDRGCGWGLRIAQSPTLNLPLWELGHIGWFQDWWLSRNPQCALGRQADPDVTRRPSHRPDADALYDSSRVSHASRSSLELPDAQSTRGDLADQLERHLALLADSAQDDAALYFFRLALLHEDMHHEAALYAAQALDIEVADARWQPKPRKNKARALALAAGTWCLGHEEPGFGFDNEYAPHAVVTEACTMDSQVVRWAEFLPFVESGAYADDRFWSAGGRHWRAQRGRSHPAVLQREQSDWLCKRWGRWLPLDLELPACQLSYFEAEAWCAWAGRCLPTEAQWERCALEQPDSFHRGDVWEWTASPFTAYPGFVAHPYRDYSAPWFGNHQVLRGASFATQPRLHHARYRNFYLAERDDIFAGFRSCLPEGKQRVSPSP
jgi:gamma-glutamyl hercynylcysteine S-oxide synthase